MRAILSLIAIVAVSGCHQAGVSGPLGPDSEPPSLMTTDRATYSGGSQVAFRLTNRTGAAFGYNLCNSRLERRDGEGDWRAVMGSLAEMCTAELRTLLPGQSVTYAFKTQPKFRPGSYRIVADLHDPRRNSRFAAVSNTFTISHDN